MGVAKTQRSSSTSSLNAQRPSNSRHNSSRNDRIASALSSPQISNTANPFNNSTPTAPTKPHGSGFSIKGKAGPYTVTASNFAPGTTAADIESAIASDAADESGVNALLSCRLTDTLPSVVAELVFSERGIAERIIRTYDRQRADGRILRLQLQSGTPSRAHSSTTQPSLVNAAKPTIDAQSTDDIEMALDTTPSQPPTQPSRYDNEREARDRDRRDRERESSRRVEPDTQEGRLTFDNNNSGSTHPPSAPPTDGRNGSRRDDRERERERERERDRERRDDRDRDRMRDREGRGYDERDREREYHRRDDKDQRPYDGGRGGYAGNGMGFNGPLRGGRGGYGSPRGRGAMHNGWMGQRGSFRGRY